MDTYGVRRLIPAVIVVIIIIFAVIALVSAGRSLFSRSASGREELNIARQELTNTAEGSKVIMHVRGPIVATEEFVGYIIEITPKNRAITLYSGYEQKTIKTITLKNSQKAYDQFVHALVEAGLLKTRTLSEDENSTVGVCADDSVYEFKVYNQNEQKQYIWTTDCRSEDGSLKSQVRPIENLFKKQIPNYEDILKQIDL